MSSRTTVLDDLGVYLLPQCLVEHRYYIGKSGLLGRKCTGTLSLLLPARSLWDCEVVDDRDICDQGGQMLVKAVEYWQGLSLYFSVEEKDNVTILFASKNCNHQIKYF